MKSETGLVYHAPHDEVKNNTDTNFSVGARRPIIVQVFFPVRNLCQVEIGYGVKNEVRDSISTLLKTHRS